MRKVLVLLFILSFLSNSAFTQRNKTYDKYRRNSLSIFIIVDNDNTENILASKAMDRYIISDKYNDHNIGFRTVNLNNISVSKEEIDKYFPKGKVLSFLDKVTEYSGVEVEESSQDVKKKTVVKLYHYINSNHIPGRLVAKWFNMSDIMENGSFFNMNLVSERGLDDATELEKLKSKEAIRGDAIIKDAGEELIGNTYAVFVRLEFITAEEMLRRTGKLVEDLAASINKKQEKSIEKTKNSTVYKNVVVKDSKGRPVKDKNGNIMTKQVQVDGSKSTRYSLESKAKKSTSKLLNSLVKSIEEDAKTTAGYYVTATSFLFRLKWNDNSFDEFIDKYYSCDNPNSVIYDDYYELEYLGNQSSYINVTEKTSFNSKNDRNIKLIERSTIRAFDESLALLQAKHENFRVKTPIITVEDKYATAFIGLKEGVNENSKFEVLEKRFNEEKQKFKYVRIGTLTVAKDKLWDNRYNIPDLETDSNNTKIDRTYLKGSTSKLAPGMLIRQIR